MTTAVDAPRTKVQALHDLAATLDRVRADGRTIVLSHGVFDLLHIGHIRHFERAKAMGDVLVVTLTPDEYVNKGPGRPAFPQALRAEAVASLGVVDYVAINHWPLSVETIRLLKPHIYVKGQDYRVPADDVTGGITLEAEAVAAVGGEIRFTDDITFSSSQLLNRHFSQLSAEADVFLSEFRRRRSVDEVVSWLDRIRGLKPMIVGEAIIDEYLFCEGIGKSTKDPVLAVLLETTTSQAGGTLAIANHLAGLCHDVRLITVVGDREVKDDFIRESLAPNVEPVLLTNPGTPTIHKRRLVDRYSGNKLFEIYVMNDRPLGPASAAALDHALDEGLAWCDLTIVGDYGHGMMGPAAISKLCGHRSFLAVNAQSNAGNRGFNPVSRYARADYVCLAMHEIFMETRQRDGDLREHLLEVGRKVKCSRFTVTRGKHGSLHYDAVDGFTDVPALAMHVLDRVGAGDAVLAVTSLLVRAGAPWDIVGFVGNVAGAELVADLGNRVPLDRVRLIKHITALMK